MFQRKQTFYQIISKFQEAPTTLFDIISQLWSFLEVIGQENVLNKILTIDKNEPASTF